MGRQGPSEAHAGSAAPGRWRGPLAARLARTLNYRRGEGRTLAVMAAFLLLNTANTTLLSAAKNGLFLSVYPGELIPHAVISAALLTALVAIAFTGVLAGTARRSLAIGLTAALGLSVLTCRWFLEIDARSGFLVYLWISVQVLTLTHAWDYAGDMLSGRRAKRLFSGSGSFCRTGAASGDIRPKRWSTSRTGGRARWRSTLWDGTTRSPPRAKHAQTSWRPTTCCHLSRR